MSSINIANFFSSGGSSSGSVNWLSDYASIKSGSYYKLMKAYYKGSDGTSAAAKSSGASTSIAQKLIDEKRSAQTAAKEKTESSSVKAYNKVQSTVGAAMDSVKKLQSTDVTDEEATANAVSSFVKSYNEMKDAAAGAADASVSSRMDSISKLVKSNEKALNGLGISIGDDGGLKLSEDTLKAADKGQIGNLFGKDSSFTKGLTTSAQMMSGNAQYAASRELLYGSSGTYNAAATSAGSLFNGFV